MRTLLAIVILAALGWSGWWFVQSTARDRAMTRLARRARAPPAGWREAEDVRVRGFPEPGRHRRHRARPLRPRRRLVLAGGRVPDPVALLQAAPRHRRADRRAGGRHPLRDDPRHQRPAARLGDLPADAAARARPLDLRDREHARSTGDAGWTAGIGKAILATRQAADGTPFAHDLAFNAESLALPRELDRRRFGPTGVLPAGDRAGRARRRRSSSTGPGTGRRSRAATRCWRRSTIRDLSLTWGKLDLRGRGTLDVDARGLRRGPARPPGAQLGGHARRGRGERARSTRRSPARVRAGLGLIARLSGDRDALEVPLDFEGGVARLGPIPLGPAPRLAQR